MTIDHPIDSMLERVLRHAAQGDSEKEQLYLETYRTNPQFRQLCSSGIISSSQIRRYFKLAEKVGE